MAEGLAVLEKQHFFAGSSYAKLVQIAFSMQCVTVGARKRLIAVGDRVQSAYVISKGTITLYAPKSATKQKNATPVLKGSGGGVFSSLRLAVAQWGHGFMIGELEILEGKETFGCTYETSMECELYEIPRKVLEVYCWLY